MFSEFLHADLVLDRPGDAGGEVQLRRHGLARLADLARIREPARVHHGARRGDGAAEGAGELLELLEALRPAEPAAARHEDVRVLDVHVGATLLAALLHRRLERVRRTSRTCSPRPSRRPSRARRRLEGVQAAR
jgi:hypothetical protein